MVESGEVIEGLGWRGSSETPEIGKGAWVKEHPAEGNTKPRKESFYPDLNSKKHKPHWDHTAKDGEELDITSMERWSGNEKIKKISIRF